MTFRPPVAGQAPRVSHPWRIDGLNLWPRPRENWEVCVCLSALVRDWIRGWTQGLAEIPFPTTAAHCPPHPSRPSRHLVLKLKERVLHVETLSLLNCVVFWTCFLRLFFSITAGADKSRNDAKKNMTFVVSKREFTFSFFAIEIFSFTRFIPECSLAPCVGI